MTPLVSILIPAYNAEKWLREAVKSAIDQTWPKKEIIIVDDGSVDNTFMIAREFESKTIKIVTQKNRGASAARNKALGIAQGDYIQWLDADDVLEPNKISEQLEHREFLMNTKILLSSSFGKFYFRRQKARFAPSRLWQDLSPIEWLLIKFTDNAWMANSTWLVSREVTEMAGLWNEEISFDDDGEYFCRVVAASEGVRFIPTAKSFYRIGCINSLSKMTSAEACKSMYLSTSLSIDNLLLLEDSERTRAACIKYCNRWLYHFFPGEMDLKDEDDECIKQVFREISVLAVKLGGILIPLKPNWKYTMVEYIFGRRLALKIRNIIYNGKMLTGQYWDGLLYKLLQ